MCFHIAVMIEVQRHSGQRWTCLKDDILPPSIRVGHNTVVCFFLDLNFANGLSRCFVDRKKMRCTITGNVRVHKQRGRHNHLRDST